jgi:UDP-N-acetylmuramate dehydrogenase
VSRQVADRARTKPASVELRRDFDLQGRNSFRLTSHAEWFAEIGSPDELVGLLHRLRSEEIPVTVIGGGTNVVLEPWLPGCVLRVAMQGITVDDAGDDVLVTAAAGESWHGLVRYCIGRGFGGIENLALIPGSVGAAPIQNIGAYGMELSQRLERVVTVDRASGNVRVMGAAECRFGYRTSIFKEALEGRCLVTSVTLRLPRDWQPVLGYRDVQQELLRHGMAPSPARVAEAVTRIRRRKLPDVRRVGNAGSFFKNPVITHEAYGALRDRLPDLTGFQDGTGFKIPAARLIEACGWKGKRVGGAMVWPRQPLVLVNAGGATSADVLALAQAIADSVLERFGVTLEREVRVLGAPAR